MPAHNTAELFTPGRLGPYPLPHRVLMAPMTRNRARRDGAPSASAVISPVLTGYHFKEEL